MGEAPEVSEFIENINENSMENLRFEKVIIDDERIFDFRSDAFQCRISKT